MYCYNPSPLRTGRATFAASGSSSHRHTRCLRLLALACLSGPFTRRYRVHLTFPSICSRCSVPRVGHPTHVGTLSGWVLPYLAGYGFPLPFGCQPSLLGPSYSRWRLYRPCSWPTLRVQCTCRVGIILYWTPSGLPRSAPLRCDRGGCPLYPGALVPLMFEISNIFMCVAPDHTSMAQRTIAPSAVNVAIFRQFELTRPHRGFTCVHPSGLPLACGDTMVSRSWTFWPASHPAVAGDAWDQWGQTPGYLSGRDLSHVAQLGATSCRTGAAWRVRTAVRAWREICPRLTYWHLTCVCSTLF